MLSPEESPVLLTSTAQPSYVPLVFTSTFPLPAAVFHKYLLNK